MACTVPDDNQSLEGPVTFTILSGATYSRRDQRETFKYNGLIVRELYLEVNIGPASYWRTKMRINALATTGWGKTRSRCAARQA